MLDLSLLRPLLPPQLVPVLDVAAVALPQLQAQLAANRPDLAAETVVATADQLGIARDLVAAAASYVYAAATAAPPAAPPPAHD